jgi:hypothetical protein
MTVEFKFFTFWVIWIIGVGIFGWLISQPRKKAGFNWRWKKWKWPKRKK